MPPSSPAPEVRIITAPASPAQQAAWDRLWGRLLGAAAPDTCPAPTDGEAAHA